MSLANHCIFTHDSIQEKRVPPKEEKLSYTLFELKSHLEDLTSSVNEVQIDIFYITKHIKELEEALNASK